MLIVHVCSLWYSHFISILCNLYKKLCIKLVSIKELYYDARPTTSQVGASFLKIFLSVLSINVN